MNFFVVFIRKSAGDEAEAVGMVFSNLQPHEKDAFFSLLDEYFSARPEIFANAAQSDGPASASTAQGAAVSAVGRAMASNPEATAKFMSAGLRQVANSRTAVSGGPGSSANASAGAGASDNEVPNMAGRVAAASLAFSNSRNNHPTSSSAGPPPVAEKPSNNLVSVKKFGESVDMSSTKNFFGSLRNKPASPPQVAVPPAFAPKQNNFGPPPRRGVSSSGTAPDPAATPPPPAPRYQPRHEEPEPEEEEEEGEAGEWAEALYEYNSGEAGDLKVEEGDRILVVERTSDDWWTGEVNGKKGLFPASYVKLL